MSTAAWIAATPSRTWVISRSSGPRTAATMQNSVAPVAAVSSAALTSSGMSSQTERTGEVNCPDCEQKWQSSGQPPVFRRYDALDLDLRSAVRHPHLVGQVEQLGDALVGQAQHLDELLLVEAPRPPSRTCACGARARMSVTRSKISPCRAASARRRSVTGRAPQPRPDAIRTTQPRCPCPAPTTCSRIDREHVWHPYTSMTDPAPTRLVTGADGVRLTTLRRPRRGRRRCRRGGRRSTATATPPSTPPCTRRSTSFAHVMFGGLTNVPAVALAERLVEITPAGLEHVFFADSGSVSVEVALKMVAAAPARASVVRSARGC